MKVAALPDLTKTSLPELLQELREVETAARTSREIVAEALFRFDYPKDDWDRLDAGRGSYNQDRYRAKADAVLSALAGTEHLAP